MDFDGEDCQKHGEDLKNGHVTAARIKQSSTEAA
jgi:hypothetical protein